MLSKGVAALHQKSQLDYFSGDQNKMVRLTADVDSHSLSKNHTFLLKETLQLCIAEEANLRLLNVKTIWSNQNNLIVAGSNFYVCATYSVQSGWHVRTACYREGDNTSKIPQNHRYMEQLSL
jgi:hypothetical protein